MTIPGARLYHRLASYAAAGLLLTLGCGQEPTAPSASDHSESPVSLAAAHPLAFRQVSAAAYHACGVTTDGRAYCWGDSRSGQLGNGTVGGGPELCLPISASCSTRPVAVVGGLRFLEVTAGRTHSCGLTTANEVYCWGENLGLGSHSGTPIRVATDLRFRALSAGGAHTCGITVTDLAFCWGFNDSGQLGIGSFFGATQTPLPVAGGFHWRQLSAGSVYTCGVTTTNRGYCWGVNNDPFVGGGFLGDGSTISRNAPAPVATNMGWLRIDAGTTHTCGINIGHRVYCWGANSSGQLGDGTKIQRLTPTPVAGTRVFNRVSANFGFTCGVTRTGQGVCWGGGSAGQLGNGTTFRRATPTPVAGGLLFADVTGGFSHSCAVTTAHRAYCWGLNFFGSLGDGTTQTRLTPTAVAGPA